jgi:hypothetical protein
MQLKATQLTTTGGSQNFRAQRQNRYQRKNRGILTQKTQKLRKEYAKTQ